MEGTDYSVVDTHNWEAHRNDFPQDPYCDAVLHSTWRPLLRELSVDHVDYTYRTPRGTDVWDGKGGSFKAKDMERKLRDLHPSELQDHLGISLHKIKDIIKRSDKDNDGIIFYADWIETVRNYRLKTEQESTLKSIGKAFAFAEEFTCSPPTYFMILITVLETGFFIYHALHLSLVQGLSITMNGPVPYCSLLIYNPRRRMDVWRFISYMFVHIGINHFVFNMIMQIFVGVFLEMEQEGYIGSLRVMAVYLSGVLAGSLGTSLTDPYAFIAGASGGVYALIAAHLATLVLNWQEDSSVKIQKVIHRPLTRIIRLVFIIVLTLHDISYAIYVRLFTEDESRTGFIGHFCGALAGLLVGIFVLQNRRVRSWEPIVQWISLVFFTLLIGFAIIWNVMGNTWSPGFFLRPDYRLYDEDHGSCKPYEYI